MQKLVKQLLIVCVGLTLAVSCKKDGGTTTKPTLPVADRPIKDISGTLTGNINWSKDTVYRLNGYVNVGVDTIQATNTPQATGVLNIEAGTVIIGQKGSTSAKPGALFIHRGSKIIAIGTSTDPIIFTSAQVDKVAGDWGGIAICGRAANNLPGGYGTLEGGDGTPFYGGGTSPDNADNSGTLKYVRIEYAGYAPLTDKELNSLTLASVGSGTTISYVQCSFGKDDAFEWFGGTVNADHLIAFKTQDDMFDTDNGFSGIVQFGLGYSSPNIADISGSNGFESDNDATGSTNTPITSASFYNITLVGPKSDSNKVIDGNFKRAAHLRRNTKLKIYNSIFSGFPTGILIDGALAETNATAGDLTIKNSVNIGIDGWSGYKAFSAAGASTYDVAAWFNDAAKNNATAVKMSDAGFNTGIYTTSAPVLSVTAGTTVNLLNGGIGGSYATYRGAFNGSDNWTSGWAEFNPDDVEYVK
ncbi:MAG: hypothetical protein U0U67_08300 [Chitinophagales bacterium]